ncbi:hypothetical protein OQA88_5908 [Cercophora sp. LCS_1]
MAGSTPAALINGAAPNSPKPSIPCTRTTQAPLYGEGPGHAFRRLQMEIMQTSFDQTLFAWRGPYESSGLPARAPSDFADTPDVRLWGPRSLSPYQMTNIGLSIRLVDVTGDVQEGDDVGRLRAPGFGTMGYGTGCVGGVV